MNRLTATAISVSLLVALHGCGVVEDIQDAVEDIQDLRPPTLHLEGNCTVVLDWTGGDNPLWDDGDLPPVDLAEFELAWPSRGWTLADVDGFREMVRAEVETVLNGSGLHVIVEEGEQRRNASVVHFSQVTDPDSDTSLGRGHFDTCNLSDRDFSIVYAAKFLEERRLDEDEWVHVFANVAAHEIAHNLGYDHVELEDVPEDSEFAELMISAQTIFQRVRDQRIIVEQDTCVVFGDDEAAKAIGSDLDRDGRPTKEASR